MADLSAIAASVRQVASVVRLPPLFRTRRTGRLRPPSPPGSGEVTVDDLRGVYDCSKHPAVKNGVRENTLRHNSENG